MKQILMSKNSIVSALCHYRFIILFGLIAMLASSCHKGDNDCKKTVPFKAVFQVEAVITQDGDPQIVDVTGTGEGTPIGKSTFVGQAEYRGPQFNFTGYGTITAANGDQIFATGIEGPGPVVDTTNGNILLIYRAKITGGTGIFAGATGSYTDVAHASTLTPAGIDSLKGTIILDPCFVNKK